MTASQAVAQTEIGMKERLREEIQADLQNNILPYWEKYTVDPRGGFYGTVSRDGKPNEEAPKGEVLNARILWTFSTAYRMLGEERYKELADRAQGYFIDHFFDGVNGGVYGSVTAEGLPLDTIKHLDGIAYAIYGFSEHFRATGNVESLQKAIELYRIIENKGKDKVKRGYFDAFPASWGSPNVLGGRNAVTASATKSMNTHIHVLEAYANLYRVWRDMELSKQLGEVIQLITDKIFNPDTGHLRCYFDSEWNPLGDTDSYGHEIETSWMLYDAALTLNDPKLIDKSARVAKAICDAAMRDGLNEMGGMTVEMNHLTGRARRSMSWWGQTETVNGCIYAWKISGDDSYLQAASKTWDFIKEHFIDKECGEWFRTCREDGTPVENEAKCSAWNCPYHNTRMGFVVMENFPKE